MGDSHLRRLRGLGCRSRASTQVGECIATWWRPHFEAEMYPYVPPHVTRPKECKRIFVVHLPEKCYFAVRCGALPPTQRGGLTGRCTAGA